MNRESSAVVLDPPRVQDGVASVFNRASGYYKSMRWDKNRLTRFEKELTRRVIEDELGSASVGSALELGCGPGTWTPLLAARASDVLAVDLSEKMLEQARESVAHENVEFLHADAARFQTGRRFDLVMSVRVLEYVPEWQSIVRRLEEFVAPGGRALIITKTPISVYRGTGRERWFGPHTMARRLTGGRLDQDFWQCHIPVRAMRQAFADAGLVDITVRPVIMGLPVYVRGNKQYPLVPEFAEDPTLRATDAAWRWVSRHGRVVRRAALPFSESYAVSGWRR